VALSYLSLGGMGRPDLADARPDDDKVEIAQNCHGPVYPGRPCL